jgi:hypothetical protein
LRRRSAMKYNVVLTSSEFKILYGMSKIIEDKASAEG